MNYRLKKTKIRGIVHVRLEPSECLRAHGFKHLGPDLIQPLFHHAVCVRWHDGLVELDALALGADHRKNFLRLCEVELGDAFETLLQVRLAGGKRCVEGGRC